MSFLFLHFGTYFVCSDTCYFRWDIEISLLCLLGALLCFSFTGILLFTLNRSLYGALDSTEISAVAMPFIRLLSPASCNLQLLDGDTSIDIHSYLFRFSSPLLVICIHELSFATPVNSIIAF